MHILVRRFKAIVEPFGLSRVLAARDEVRVNHVDVEVSSALVVVHGEQVYGSLGLGSLLASQVSPRSDKLAPLKELLLLLLEEGTLLLFRVRGIWLGLADLVLDLDCVFGLGALESFIQVNSFRLVLPNCSFFALLRICLTAILTNKQLSALLLHRCVPSIQVIHTHLSKVFVILFVVLRFIFSAPNRFLFEK